MMRKPEFVVPGFRMAIRLDRHPDPAPGWSMISSENRSPPPAFADLRFGIMLWVSAAKKGSHRPAHEAIEACRFKPPKRHLKGKEHGQCGGRRLAVGRRRQGQDRRLAVGTCRRGRA